MKMKTKDLTGRALNHAITLAQGWEYFPEIKDVQCALYCRTGATPTWTTNVPDFTNDSQADDIIDERGISIIRCDDDYNAPAPWAAVLDRQVIERSTEHQTHDPMYRIYADDVTYGATRREAAMRAWARHVLGEELNIPEELK